MVLNQQEDTKNRANEADVIFCYFKTKRYKSDAEFLD